MASITQGLALLERMGYRPAEVEISNGSRYKLDFLIKMEVPRTSSFRCYEFSLSPYRTTTLDKVISAIESVILNRKCTVELKFPSQELFLNLYQRPTRDSCHVIINEKDVEQLLLPLDFKDGIDLRSVQSYVLELMEMPLNKRLIEHYSTRYSRFIQEQLEFKTGAKTKCLLEHESLIPKVFHFIWLGSFLKKEDQKNIETFRKMHPDWEIKIWIDHLPVQDHSALENDMLHFAKENGISLQPISEFFAENMVHGVISRIEEIVSYALANSSYGMASDALRMAILYLQGGVYSDCDNICFRPFDRLNKSHTLFAGLCPVSKGFIKINNDIIGAQKGHPIVERYLNEVIEYFDKTHEIFTKDQILRADSESEFIQGLQILKTIHSTGPIPFSKSYRMYINDHDDPLVMIYPPDVFHPGSREVHDFTFDKQPAPSSYSAACFDMGWVSTQGSLMRQALTAEENFDKHQAIIARYLAKPKASATMHQIHFFSHRIFKGVPKLLDWLLEDKATFKQIEVLDLLLTDVAKEDIEKVLPHLDDESIILVSSELKSEFSEIKKVHAIGHD